MSRVIVIGGGVGGLAAAARLAHAGHVVTLLEKNEYLGGKVNLIEDRGFTFDLCPALLTFPRVFDRLFADVGKSREEYLPLVPLDPQRRAFFEDGSRFDVWGDPARMEEEIRRFFPGDVEGFRRFGGYAERMHKFLETHVFWRNVGGLQEALAAGHLSNWQTLRALAGLDLHRTAAGVLRAHIRDSKLRQALGSFWQVSGSSPFRSPAVLAAFHHIQSRFGVWYPPGGMNRVAQALGHLVQDLGVLIRLGSPVEKILARGPRVTGVVTNGKTLPADAIVSNGDFVRTHRELLPDTATARRIEARPGAFEPTCSGVVFFFGLDRRYDQLRHHAFFFSRDPAREFEDIFERGVPTEDPTLSVCAPSRTDPSVAPDGCENVSVLVHAPSPRPGREESKLLGHTRALVIQKLERMGLEDFGRRIRVQHVQTPADVERLYGANRGALYGLASHGRLRGGFKPANRSADYENLYFAGGGANPGPGLPLSVMSGQIAANCFLKDAGVTNPSSLGD